MSERIAAIKERLRKVLEHVTPGPWAYEPHGDTGEYGVGVLVGPESDEPLSGYQDDSENVVSEPVAVEVHGVQNAAYIANCDPQTIAAILDDHDALTKERDNLLSSHRILNVTGAKLQDRIAALEAEVARLREALEPFAKRAIALDVEESLPFGHSFADNELVTFRFESGEFRRARAALNKEGA